MRSNRYCQAAIDAVNAIEEDWRETASEGWYVINRTAPVIYAGAEWGHNHNNAMALVYIHLANATGNNTYRTRAAKLLARFANNLRLSTGGTFYVWTYFHTKSKGYTGWTREEHISDRIPYAPKYETFEDIRHGGHGSCRHRLP